MIKTKNPTETDVPKLQTTALINVDYNIMMPGLIKE